MTAHRVFWVGVVLEWVGIVGMLWRWRKGAV
jgi:hypothetical protein